MARAICRCGQPLEIPSGEVSHIVCPTCSARVRIVRKPRSDAEVAASPGSSGDGYARFACPCGRKLKVNLRDHPTHGRCPECGRVVPVPSDAATYTTPDADTAEMSPTDRARLDAWVRRHQGPPPAPPSGSSTASALIPALEPGSGTRAAPHKNEAGLRICPQCGKPVHMAAETCRACGASVPRR